MALPDPPAPLSDLGLRVLPLGGVKGRDGTDLLRTPVALPLLQASNPNPSVAAALVKDISWDGTDLLGMPLFLCSNTNPSVAAAGQGGRMRPAANPSHTACCWPYLGAEMASSPTPLAGRSSLLASLSAGLVICGEAYVMLFLKTRATFSVMI